MQKMNNSSGFIDKIRKDLIFTNVPGETWEELLRSVAARLYAAGVVNEGYADALVFPYLKRDNKERTL